MAKSLAERTVIVSSDRGLADQPVRRLPPTLDRGEAEVSALALEVNADRVLIDELTGRQVAESWDLRIGGSGEIVIRAKQWAYLAIQPDLQPMRSAGIDFSDRFSKNDDTIHSF